MPDTIVALATAPGRAAVAVIRLSGPGTRAALASLGVRRLRPRRASLRRLRDAEGFVLDHALTLLFAAPASFTGEDCAELHIHGGPVVADSVIAALLAMGLRLAAPGEFTRRAFENGKLDLTQAEAVADLIEAESTAQARQATAQLEGALGRRYEFWRARFVDILGFLEAAVDFPDEHLPEALEGRARGPMEMLIADLDVALADGGRGRRIRDGYRVAIVGAPNAGKSSLLNQLAGREAAIVTPTAGTTRDVIETPLVVGGFAILLADMAGLREAFDVVEREGVRRARAWADSADLRLWVVDRAGREGDWRLAADVIRPGDLCLLNKGDLPLGADGELAEAAARALNLDVLSLSLTGGDLGALHRWLAERVARELAGSDFPATTRARHETGITAAREHLHRALAVLGSPELAAEDVRLAARELARVTGGIGAEDVLDQVFASFCIGK